MEIRLEPSPSSRIEVGAPPSGTGFAVERSLKVRTNSLDLIKKPQGEKRSLRPFFVFLLLLGLSLESSGCSAPRRWAVMNRLGLTCQPYLVVEPSPAEPLPEGESRSQESPPSAPPSTPESAAPQFRLARSPQPDRGDLEVLRDDGFRTVLNLRGPSPEKDWYREEVEACADFGLELIDLRISSRQGPDEQTVDELLEILGDPGKGPILIHCHGGVHRTGFAVAAFRVVYEGWDADRAIEEMYDYGFGYQGEKRQALVRRIRDLEPKGLGPRRRKTPRSNPRRFPRSGSGDPLPGSIDKRPRRRSTRRECR